MRRAAADVELHSRRKKFFIFVISARIISEPFVFSGIVFPLCLFDGIRRTTRNAEGGV